MFTVPLIGRIEESAKIDRFFEVLPDGSRCLLLLGELGIGKTALLNWGRTRATTCGYRVLSASPVESEVPLEFAALADLLEKVPPAIVEELPDPQRRAVAVAVFRNELADQPVDPRTLATAVLGTFRRLVADTPLVLAIDDLPWLDLPSARVLSYVLRRAGDIPLGLVGTVRTEWSGDRAPLLTDPMSADRMVRVKVGPMAGEEIVELLAERTGLNLGRTNLRRLQELSRGNPLFALELAEANAVDGAGISGGSMSMPKSLRRLVKGRIGHLPSGSQDVLLVAALSAELELPVVLSAAADPVNAAESFELVVQAGIIGRSDDGIAFAHPLIRSIVAEDATAGNRREAHRRLATSVRHPEERARHRALGANGPDEAIAKEVEEASVSAVARGACETAAALAEIAVNLTPRDRTGERHRRMALEAENWFEASEPDRAVALLEEIIEVMVPGSIRAEMLRRLARYQAYRGDHLTTWITRLVAALDESGEALVLRCSIAFDLCAAAINGGDQNAARTYGELALDLALQTGDTARQGQAAGGMAYLAFCKGEGVRRDLVETGARWTGASQPFKYGTPAALYHRHPLAFCRRARRRSRPS